MTTTVVMYTKKEWMGVGEAPTGALLPLWCNTEHLNFYDDARIIMARNGERVVGFWIVPIEQREDGTKHAIRTVRLFPYASPWLEPTTSYERRSLMVSMFTTLCSAVSTVALPMCPDFNDVTGLVAQRAFIEWRHTYCCSLIEDPAKQFSAKVASHIRHAKEEATIEIVQDAATFSYVQAIKQSTPEVIARRRLLALSLYQEGRAAIFRCRSRGDILGEAFLVCGDSTAYLFHSWYDSGQLRGVPSLLIDAAIRYAREEKHLIRFDFEGSILASIDRFMSGFGGAIVSYPFVYWAVHEALLTEALLSSLHIPGRCNETCT